MKYENPKCEIVVLDSADCLTSSPNADSPMTPYSVKYGRDSYIDSYSGYSNY